MAMAAKVLIRVAEGSTLGVAASKLVVDTAMVAALMVRLAVRTRGEVEAARAMVVARAMVAAEAFKVTQLTMSLVEIMCMVRPVVQPA
jgi:hypothetical protein